MISENDIVAKINEDIRKKQKLDERISLLSKKRRKDKNDSEHKIFKRVDCHPTTLFDSRDISNNKKEETKDLTKEKSLEEKEKKKKKNNNFCYAQKIKKFKDFISEKGNLIEEMVKYEKEKKNNESNNDIDMSLFFKLASINYDVYNKMIMNENKKKLLLHKLK